MFAQLCVLSAMVVFMCMPASIYGLCPDIPEFTRERLLYLVTHKLINDEDTETLMKAEANQLNPVETRAFYISLNELYMQTRRHQRAQGNSFFTIQGLAAFTVISIVSSLCYALIRESPAPATPAVRINTAGTPGIDYADPERPTKIDIPLRPAEFRASDLLRKQERKLAQPKEVYNIATGTLAHQFLYAAQHGFPHPTITNEPVIQPVIPQGTEQATTLPVHAEKAAPAAEAVSTEQQPAHPVEQTTVPVILEAAPILREPVAQESVHQGAETTSSQKELAELGKLFRGRWAKNGGRSNIWR